MLLPHLKGLPEHEGKEVGQDVSLDSIGRLMSDGAHVQLVFADAEVASAWMSCM